jgi:CheY-like chemotaxis protein
VGRLRVLLVDDHTIFRAGLRTMLEAEGIDVVEARSGEAAVELGNTARPDVVLMDLHMPGMSGTGDPAMALGRLPGEIWARGVVRAIGQPARLCSWT